MMLPWVFAVFSIHQSLCRGVFFFFFDRRPGRKRPWATPGPTLPQPPPPKKAPLSKSAFPPFPHLLSLVDVFTPGLFLAPFLVYTIAPLLFLCSFRWRGAHHQLITMCKLFSSPPEFGVGVCLLASDPWPSRPPPHQQGCERQELQAPDNGGERRTRARAP